MTECARVADGVAAELFTPPVLAALSCVFTASQAFASGNCDNRSLAGSYSFRVEGANLGLLDASNVFHPFTSPEPFAGVGQSMFDGNGGFTRTDYNVGLGTPAFPPSPVNDQGFRTGVTGTYSVSEDCTGTITVGLLTTGTQVVLAIAVVDYGQTVFGAIKTNTRVLSPQRSGLHIGMQCGDEPVA